MAIINICDVLSYDETYYYAKGDSAFSSLPLDVLRSICLWTATGKPGKKLEPARYSVDFGRTCRLMHLISHKITEDALRFCLIPLQDDALLKMCDVIDTLPKTLEQIKIFLKNSDNTSQITTPIVLRNAKIRVVSPDITLFSNLTSLSLPNNKIINIPNEIDKLAKLILLNLSHNKIITIPTTIGNLCQLQTLDLSDNQIKNIPTTIIHLSRLESLVLSQNRITNFLHDIDKLAALTLLNVSKNNIRSIPNTIAELSQLVDLNLSHNQIVVIPTTIGKLNSLTHLKLKENPLLNINLKSTLINIKSVVNETIGFSQYLCLSGFSKFIRLASEDTNFENIQAAFNNLEDQDKKLIYEMVSQLVDDPDFTLEKLFDDRNRFYQALKASIIAKFDRLPLKNKNRLYGFIYELAGSPYANDPNWGEHHCFENTLRLVDAMHRLQDENV